MLEGAAWIWRAISTKSGMLSDTYSFGNHPATRIEISDDHSCDPLSFHDTAHSTWRSSLWSCMALTVSWCDSVISSLSFWVWGSVNERMELDRSSSLVPSPTNPTVCNLFSIYTVLSQFTLYSLVCFWHNKGSRALKGLILSMVNLIVCLLCLERWSLGQCGTNVLFWKQGVCVCVL